jgi:hypothetical protein
MRRQAWCPDCEWWQELPVITAEGLCGSCKGSPRDCECSNICPDCEFDLVHQPQAN